MIILDLSSELDPIYQTTESYYGQPFIWCMLHNFGGTMELYGMLDTINTVCKLIKITQHIDMSLAILRLKNQKSDYYCIQFALKKNGKVRKWSNC